MEALFDLSTLADVMKGSPYSKSMTFSHVVGLLLFCYIGLFVRIVLEHHKDSEQRLKKENVETKPIIDDGDKKCNRSDS